MMKKIVISFTVEKGSTDEQFEGNITFKSEKSDQLSFNFIWQIPKGDKRLNDINIKFSNENENFNINKTLFMEQYVKLTERQQIVLGLSIMILPDMIDKVKISKIKAEDTIYQEIEEEVYKVIF